MLRFLWLSLCRSRRRTWGWRWLKRWRRLLEKTISSMIRSASCDSAAYSEHHTVVNAHIRYLAHVRLVSAHLLPQDSRRFSSGPRQPPSSRAVGTSVESGRQISHLPSGRHCDWRFAQMHSQTEKLPIAQLEMR